MNSPEKYEEPNLREALEKLRPVPDRDLKVAAQTRANFLSQAESLQAPVSIPLSLRLNGWIAAIRRKERKIMLTTLSTLLVLALLFGGTGVTAYAAQDSMPDDFLYPVKIFTEDVQLALEGDVEDDFTLLITFTDRRFDEMEVLLFAGEPLPQNLAERLEKQIEAVFELAATMDDEDEDEANNKIHRMLQDRDQDMTMAGANIPENVDPVFAKIRAMVNARLRVMEEGLETPLQNQFKQQMGGPDGETGPEMSDENGNQSPVVTEPPGKQQGEGYGPGEPSEEPQPGPGEPDPERSGPAAGEGDADPTAEPSQNFEGPKQDINKPEESPEPPKGPGSGEGNKP
jgi:hypothetical protein